MMYHPALHANSLPFAALRSTTAPFLLGVVRLPPKSSHPEQPQDRRGRPEATNDVPSAQRPRL